jgi:2-dehydro-3-deoxyphosphogluconate aldolase/(4S)-4-hydroxy-2-oxoglutarate aldolase
MAKFSKLHTLGVMVETGMVPVYYHADAETACRVVRACYAGGVRVFEFTNRGDYALEVFTRLSKYVAAECPDLVLGAGTIVDAPTAALYLQAGANFVVGPLFDPDIARLCNRRLIPYLPGCGSVTEISRAQEAGCDICKLFPAGAVGGPAFVKSILAPLPWSLLMATGSVEPAEENLKAWFRAGITCVGMGSRLFPEKTIEAGDWNALTRLCRDTLTLIHRIKN